MAAAGGKIMGAERTTDGAARSKYDRRALVVWVESVDFAAGAELALVPSRFEIGAIVDGIVAAEEIAVDENCPLDEVACRRCKYRLSLCVVAVEQIGLTPALQACSKLPREIDRVFQPAVDAV